MHQSQVYYWARGRDDGSNVTSQGQDAHQHLKKITSLIRTIVGGPETGARRDILLQRSITAPAGIPSVFGKRFITDFNAEERRDAIDQVRGLVTPLWTAELRSQGNLEAQLLTDLIVANKQEDIEAVSQALSNGDPIPLSLDDETNEPIFISADGTHFGDFSLSLYHRLEDITVHPSAVTVVSEVGLNGMSTPPDSSKLVWVHRKLGTEVEAIGEAIGQFESLNGSRTLIRARTELFKLETPSEWDAFIEAAWGRTVIRSRFGKTKSAGVSSDPTSIGSPSSMVLFYTRFGNLSIDVGPTKKYPAAKLSAVPAVLSKHQLARYLLVTVQADFSHLSRAQWAKDESAKFKECSVIRHSADLVTVVVPQPMRKLNEFVLLFEDEVLEPVRITIK